DKERRDAVEPGDIGSGRDGTLRTDDERDKSHEEQPEFVEVEFDGELYEVPPKLKDALLRTSDYTQKTQEVAAVRKAVEAEQALIAQERKRYEFINEVSEEISQVQQIEAAIPQWKEHLKNNIDSLSTTDIEKIRMTIDELSTQRDAIKQALQGKYSEFQQAQEQSRKELLDKSTEALRSKFSDWNGEEVADYAKSLGFTEDQVAMAQLDPKQMELVRKAMLYDRLQQNKGQAVAKVKGAPQIKPKNRKPMPKDVGRKLNFRKKFAAADDPKVKEKLAAEEIFARIS
ncbi:MAG: hypothetical protein R3282_08045, partial [Rhodothermales bacterium]|nr:hypothetical protein [Rhodothermales bacterium]